MIYKIVVIGPESTGKSTLCEQLAKYYNTVWVPEYAREYLEKNGTDYTFGNLLDIAKSQLAMEENYTEQLVQENQGALASKAISKLFIDTDMYVMKVWNEFVFNKCHNWILNQIVKRRYHLYLLCNVDLAWVKDNLREYPDLTSRNKLYHYYKEDMLSQQVPWVDISGNYQQRLSKAVEAIDQLTS